MAWERLVVIMAILLVSLVFTSGCAKENPAIEDAFSPDNMADLGNLQPPTEPPFDPTPVSINKSIEYFFSG